MEEANRHSKHISLLNEPSRKQSPNWFLIGCFVFALIKIAYLFIGYNKNLYVQSYEDLARFWFSWNFYGLKPIAIDTCWLPLHLVLQSVALSPRVLPFFSASLFQTAVSIAGGIFGALIAYDICNKNWKAGVGALVAWLGSARLTLMGIGFLSEPLLQLEMLAAIWFGLKFVKEGKRKWWLWSILSIYAMELTRYEGWFFSAALFLLWSSAVLYCSWRKCGHGYAGLKQSTPVQIIISGGLIGVPPLVWLLVNYLVKGDPFFFINATKEYVLVNIPFLFQDRVEFLMDFIRGIWFCQPLVILFGFASLLWRDVRRGPGVVLIFCIFILYYFNFLSIMNGSTAFSFPERLSSNIFVLFCPLFGLFCYHFFCSFRKEAKIVLPPVLLSMMLMGFFSFWTAEPVLENTMGRGLVDSLAERLEETPQHPRPRALIETTQIDYSIVLFAIALDKDDWLGFNRQTNGTLEGVLAENKSIRYLVLNHNSKNVRWIMRQKVFKLVVGGSVWDLYEYRQKTSVKDFI